MWENLVKELDMYIVGLTALIISLRLILNSIFPKLKQTLLMFILFIFSIIISIIIIIIFIGCKDIYIYLLKVTLLSFISFASAIGIKSFKDMLLNGELNGKLGRNI
jgi:hypothetical protein